MSMDTPVFGAIQPPSGSRDDKGKSLKRKPESKPESDSDSDSEPESELVTEEESESKVESDPFWFEKIAAEDLKESDFADRYDKDPYPFHYMCPSFVYMNPAMKNQRQKTKQAVADYLKITEDISPFDAIDVPRDANVCGNNFPKPMDLTDNDATVSLLKRLSQSALDKYSSDNQGIKYEFHKLVKATRCRIPLVTYYITFQATHVHVDPSNCPATTFQAQVQHKISGEALVKSCSIKTSN